MKKVTKLLFLSLIFCVCFSCEESDADIKNGMPLEILLGIESSAPFLTFGETGGVDIITLTANAKWTASVASVEDESWLKIDINEGNSTEGQDVSISVLPSADPVAREGKLIFACVNVVKTIVVKQTQYNSITILDESALTVLGHANEMDVKISSNIDVDIEVEEEANEWLSCVLKPVDTKSNVAERIYTVKLGENLGELRSGKIIFKNVDAVKSDTLFISQAKHNSLVVNGDEILQFTNELQTKEIAVNSNVVLTPEIPANGSGWLTCVLAPENPATKAVTERKYIITAQPNETFKQRASMVIFNTSEGEDADTIKVNQMQTNAIILDRATIPADGMITGDNHKYDITVDANVDVENVINYINGEKWITCVKKGETAEVSENGLAQTTYTISISQSANLITRTGTVTFKNTDANLTQTITFTQAKIISDLIVSVKSVVSGAGIINNETVGVYGIPATGADGKIVLGVEARKTWEITPATIPEWITLSATNGTVGAAEITITELKANTATTPRTATLTVQITGETTTETIKITQLGADVNLTVNGTDNVSDLPADANNNIQLTLNSNAPWTATKTKLTGSDANANWLTIP